MQGLNTDFQSHHAYSCENNLVCLLVIPVWELLKKQWDFNHLEADSVIKNITLFFNMLCQLLKKIWPNLLCCSMKCSKLPNLTRKPPRLFPAASRLIWLSMFHERNKSLEHIFISLFRPKIFIPQKYC